MKASQSLFITIVIPFAAWLSLLGSGAQARAYVELRQQGYIETGSGALIRVHP